MNNKFLTIALVVVSLLLGGLLVKTFLDNRELSDSNSRLNEELMQSNLELGKARTQFGEANAKLKELDDNLKAALAKNKELITAYGILKARFEAQGGNTNIPIPLPDKPVDPLNLEENSLYLSLSKDKLLPLGKGLAAQFKDHRIEALTMLETEPSLHFSFAYKLKLEIGGQLVQTITPSGAVNHYLSLYELVNGQKAGRFQLESFEVLVVDQRVSRFFLWAPHLDIAAIVGWNGLEPQYGASLGISFMGYGLTYNDLSWRFLRLGLTIPNERIGLDLAPVLWNLGGPLPLVSNLWIAPFASLTFPNFWGGGLILGVVL